MTNAPPAHIVSLDGRYRVEGGAHFCGHCSAPAMLRDGQPCGVYVDDTTPERRKWVEIALLHHPPPQTVYVAIATNESRQRLESHDMGIPHVAAPQLIRLREHLPWGFGYPWREYGPVRDCGDGNGYILQYDWHGPQGKKRPNVVCRQTCTRQARKHHPRMIFKV